MTPKGQLQALTEQQSMAAYYLGAGLSNVEVAKKVGTTPSTVSVWTRNSNFQEELERWKEATVEKFGVTLVRSQLAILGLTEQAAAVAQKAMQEEDEDGQPTSRALKAAIEIMRKVPLAAKGDDGTEQVVANAAVIVVNMDSDGNVSKRHEIEAAADEVDAETF